MVVVRAVVFVFGDGGGGSNDGRVCETCIIIVLII